MWNGQEREDNKVHPVMSEVTEKSYEDSKKNLDYLMSAKRMANSRIAELLDAIISERQSIKDYEDCIEYNKEVILMWEVKSGIKK